MRIPREGEDLVGSVCVCSIGRPAIVTHATQFCTVTPTAKRRPEYVSAWAGLGLDGKGNWLSTNPCIIAESGREFYQKLQSRFGGKTGP